MKLLGKTLMLAGLFALAACNSTPEKTAAAGQAVDADDTCGAAQYQSYVGKPLSALQGVQVPGQVRTIPYNSAVTMDFNMQRLNFLGDKDDKITRVYCG
jgi:hypothetical protein